MPSGEGGRGTGESMAGRPLFGRLLERVGFDRLAGADRIPGDAEPLTWYALAVVALGMVGPQVYNLAIGRPVVFVRNPLLLL